MKKIFVILILVLFAGAILFIAVGVTNTDPRYQERTATGWALVLNSSSPKEQEPAARALKHLGSNGVPSLIQMLNKTNYSRSDKAFEVIAPRLPNSLKLRAYEKHFPIEPMRARLAAAQALQAVGPQAIAAVPALCKSLEDTNVVATASGYALAAIGREAIPAVSQTLRSTNIAVQKMALFTLGQMRTNGADAVPALLPQLNHPDPEIQSAAENAFRQIGSAAAPKLQNLLQNGNSQERLSAAKVLGFIQPSSRESTEALIAALGDTDPSVRRQVIESLGTMRAGFSPVINAVSKSLQDTNSEVRLEAVKILGRAGSRAQIVAPQLTPLLNDDDASIRAATTEALNKITNTPPRNKTS